MPLLRVSNLSTSFATDRGPLRAVDGVSLSLERGETLGIVGESGSGKSVLVRTIMGLLARSARLNDDAEIDFDGRDLRQLDPRTATRFWGSEIAMVFQDPLTSLNPVRKIGAQMTDPLRRHLGLDRAAARARAQELLATVGIPDAARRLDEYPHQLSGGMRQRVTIASAISCEPRLLIADEPTTALDVTVQKQILDLLAELQSRLDMAMILITHDLGVVASYADRIAVMYAGRIVEEARSIDLFDHTRHPYTEALMASIPRMTHESHTRLDAISGRPPDMTAPPAGCSFSPRCRYAQETCLDTAPVLEADPAERARATGPPLATTPTASGTPTVSDTSTGFGAAQHRHACFTPVGSPAAEAALERNTARGHTAAGLELHSDAVSA